MAEVVRFVVPAGRGKTLLVWGLSPGPTAEALQHALFAAFSRFGLLYSVRVAPNAAGAAPGFHAVVKFYSARDARRAREACHRQPLGQKAPVKVLTGTRHWGFQQRDLVLSSSKCRDLANYYLGFNGWSQRVLLLQNLSGFDEQENSAAELPCSGRRLQYLCVVEVALSGYACQSRGVGMAEEHVSHRAELLGKVKETQKLAVQKALSNAFQKLQFVVLESGKVVVECRSSGDSELEEGVEGLLQRFPGKFYFYH
ncbi:RAD52 motif-containing protein 1-like isoform X3 [Tachyglossus aculeatus]|uniref:RAD52 motif-containing protein 1-like isoform X3 n=1 Tax=Tachyglossus aculeatus TaxID=9261 RepID=UPI0018F36948|nr:RAD52 motif-containing protein 1-like isoform X3 [Tachyglossus aculeatus]